MAKPPRRGGEMRVFYPVFQVTELAAGYRYTTKWLLKGGNVMRRYLSAVMLINLNSKTIPLFQQYGHRMYYESLVLYISIHGNIPPSSLYHTLPQDPTLRQYPSPR